MNYRKILELEKKYSEILGSEVTLDISSNMGIYNVHLSIYYLPKYSKIKYPYNLFSYSQFNHPNCGMEIIQSINFSNALLYAPEEVKNSIKEKEEELNLIFKDCLKQLTNNKHCFFTFQEPTYAKIIRDSGLGFVELANYRNYNHSTNSDRSILMIDLYKFELDDELKKLVNSKEKEEKKEVKLKATTVRKSRKRKAELQE